LFIMKVRIAIYNGSSYEVVHNESSYQLSTMAICMKLLIMKVRISYLQWQFVWSCW